jgi:hypothetical protein
MERAVSFLVKELKVCTQKEASERIFFVSAKEALQARLLEQNGQPAHSKNKTPIQPYQLPLLAVEEGQGHTTSL